jgi:folate-binding protein YgfZ
MLDIATQYRIITTPVDPAGAGAPADRRDGSAPSAVGTAAAAAGWRIRADRGRLKFGGADRLTFLQALVTNDVASLAAGQSAYAAYLTPQGRMITDMRLHARAGHVLADVPAALASNLAARFDQLIFAEDVQVTDVSSEIAQIDVAGVGAADLLARMGEQALHGGFAAGADNAPFLATPPLAAPPALPRLPAIPVIEVFLPAAAVADFTRTLDAAGAIALSDDLAAALRIEAGRPSFGIDMTEDTIPLEAGLLDRAISTTKGCYVGQEVIIRVLHRGGGRVAKRLVRLDIDRAVTQPPPQGTRLFADDQETGRITSAAFSPASNRVVALGYVHRDVAEVGRAVRIGSEPGADAVIARLAG